MFDSFGFWESKQTVCGFWGTCNTVCMHSVCLVAQYLFCRTVFPSLLSPVLGDSYQETSNQSLNKGDSVGKQLPSRFDHEFISILCHWL